MTMPVRRQIKAEDAVIGGRIRARRMMLGMSQEHLAEQLDVTFQQVQKYEKGTNRVGGSRLIMCAKALSCHVGYFFDEAEPVANGLDRIDLDIAREVHGLPNGARQAVRDLIRALAP